MYMVCHLFILNCKGHHTIVNINVTISRIEPELTWSYFTSATLVGHIENIYTMSSNTKQDRIHNAEMQQYIIYAISIRSVKTVWAWAGCAWYTSPSRSCCTYQGRAAHAGFFLWVSTPFVCPQTCMQGCSTCKQNQQQHVSAFTGTPW